MKKRESNMAGKSKDLARPPHIFCTFFPLKHQDSSQAALGTGKSQLLYQNKSTSLSLLFSVQYAPQSHTNCTHTHIVWWCTFVGVMHAAHICCLGFACGTTFAAVSSQPTQHTTCTILYQLNLVYTLPELHIHQLHQHHTVSNQPPAVKASSLPDTGRNMAEHLCRQLTTSHITCHLLLPQTECQAFAFHLTSPADTANDPQATCIQVSRYPGIQQSTNPLTH
jgi:hypothetical protein